VRTHVDEKIFLDLQSKFEYPGAMYVERVPNRTSPPAVLLRESVREGNKTRKRTLANLSHWPEEQVATLRRVLKGEKLVHPNDALEIVRSLPHGHVAAVLGTMRELGVPELIDRGPSRCRDLVVAMIAARILDPRSKLATARELDSETASNSLSAMLGMESLDEDDLYRAMDWVLPRQQQIEQQLAQRHLAAGALVLYDLTSTYFEGRHCPLACLGYSRDERFGNPQIVIGLLTNAAGCPVAVEVLEGNTADPKTVGKQVSKLRERFGLEHVILVGDRGTLTSARIREDLQPAAQLQWITALRSPQILALAKSESLQLSLFDERDLAEIEDPGYPGERLIACRNPLLAAERARKRNELLAMTEQRLRQVVAATQRARRPLRGKEAITLAAGKALGRYKMGKHFQLQIEESSFSFQRKQDSIDEEAALDGIYVLRTNVPAARLSSEQAVQAYKGLSHVERAFRSLKSVDLKIRPVHHRLADRVRSHVLLCMLAWYVEWHLRERLAPLLFDDSQPSAGEALRDSVVAPAQRSPQAQDKALRKRTDDDLPVHSFQTLLQDLRTIAWNTVRMGQATFRMITTPTRLQQRVFDLLSVPLQP
jgi:transposase